MKLSSVLASGLFLSCIAASPISVPAATESSTANEPKFQSDNSTDISMEGFDSCFCFKRAQKQSCHGGSFNKCVKYYSSQPSIGVERAPSFCGFWCTKMEKTKDCGFNKLKFNYHPDWSCDDAEFHC
ncbi:putative secreted protein [Wickerhamomyces ciferrii]|uniref:Secreted protein n=1 Tax=Wickerhamomyces ciferrii (strain ATCC 14091 / BCRC 22168 / CBS 111 / JCM 3599 / NBRC 0793 / NRRL Y-1031 F-60-10) TaxID=1206466 RepID=K0L0A6_WICCF|nr:uncharacterized protein BN7_6643 [Wickerhamomyces ciferrii]CCH47034.1 putative secreted protein [Wickerhamomyces ciferrii]